MKIPFIKSLIAAAVCAVLTTTAAQQAPLIVKTTVNKDLYNLTAAEKRFAEGDPSIVKLVPLTLKQLEQIATLSDANRLTGAMVKAMKEDYQYTLDSAADQAQKEEEKMEEGGEEEQQTATSDVDTKAGDISFYVLSSSNGLNFVFRSTNRENAKYEIILKPTTPGRFAGSEVHFIFEQSSHIWSTTLLGPSCYPLNSNPVANGFRPEYLKAADGAVITRISLDWTTVYRILGELPMIGGQPTIWEFSVFRWAKSGSSTLRSTPRDPDAHTYLMVSPISEDAITGIKGSFAQKNVDDFFRVDPKKGNPTDNYIGGVLGKPRDLHLWLERLDIPPRIAYPGPMSEFFLGKMHRRIPKPVLGDEEKTKELDYRLTEWKEEMTYNGKDLKDRAYSTALIDELTRLEIETYLYPSIAFWALRFEAIQNRVFSDAYFEDILKLK